MPETCATALQSRRDAEDHGERRDYVDPPKSPGSVGRAFQPDVFLEGTKCQAGKLLESLTYTSNSAVSLSTNNRRMVIRGGCIAFLLL